RLVGGMVRRLSSVDRSGSVTSRWRAVAPLGFISLRLGLPTYRRLMHADRRQLEWGYAPDHLSTDAERLTARGQHLKPGAVVEEQLDQGGASLDQVLTVIEQY